MNRRTWLKLAAAFVAGLAAAAASSARQPLPRRRVHRYRVEGPDTFPLPRVGSPDPSAPDWHVYSASAESDFDGRTGTPFWRVEIGYVRGAA